MQNTFFINEGTLECYNGDGECVVVPAGVTKIGEDVFRNNESIKEITLPRGLLEIDKNAFRGCGILKVVNLPRGLLKIGDYAFSSCFKLEQINLPRSLEKIGKCAFFNCKALASIDLSSNLKSIEKELFSGCVSLESVILPRDLETMKERCFKDCASLVEITLPRGLSTIESSAFESCVALKRIVIPEKILKIEGSLFRNCRELEEALLPRGLESIESAAFMRCTALKSITLPEGIREIGWNAFCGCTALEKIDLPEGIKELSSSTFFECTALKNVTLPRSLSIISNGAFGGCTSLRELELPSSLDCVSTGAFDGCTSLSKIRAPRNVVGICKGKIPNGCKIKEVKGAEAKAKALPPTWYLQRLRWYELIDTWFYNQDKHKRLFNTLVKDDSTLANVLKLKKIDVLSAFLKNAPRINLKILNQELETAHKRRDLEATALLLDYKEKRYTRDEIEELEAAELNISMGKSDLLPNEYELIFDYTVENNEITITNLKIEDKEIEIPEKIGNSYVTKIGRTAFKNKIGLREVALPRTITSIEDYAFYGCDNLVDVTLPEGLKKIGKGAFAQCRSLTRLEIPMGIESIEDNTFFHCNSLKEIALPRSIKKIGRGVFDNCEHLVKISLPEGLEEIGAGAFENCTDLRDIVLPSTLNTMGKNTFRYCTNLREIILPGGLKSVGEDAFRNCKSLVYVEVKNTRTKIGKGAFYSCPSITEIVLPKGADMSGRWYLDKLEWSLIAPLALNNYPCDSRLVRYICDNFSEAMRRTFPDNATYFFLREEMKEKDNATIEKEKNALIDRFFEKINKLSRKSLDKLYKSHCFKGENEIKLLKYECSLYGKEDNVDYYKDKFDFFVSDKGITITDIKSSDSVIEIPERIGNRSVIAIWLCQEDTPYTRVILPSTIKEISSESFKNWKSLKEINLPEGILGIEASTFEGCESLKGIKLPSTIEYIKQGAFKDCVNLEQISSLKEIKEIGKRAFENCKSLKGSLALDSLRIVEEKSFKNCSSIKGAVLSQHLEGICRSAFEDCVSLAKVSCSKRNRVTVEIDPAGGYTITTCDGVEDFAFKGCKNLVSVKLPMTTSHIGKLVFCGCSRLEAIELDKRNRFYISADGALYTRDKKKLIAYPMGKRDKEYKAPDELVKICKEAFNDNPYVERSILPRGLESIEEKAFKNCTGLKKIVIPDGSLVVALNAFENCQGLTIYTEAREHFSSWATYGYFPGAEYIIWEARKKLARSLSRHLLNLMKKREKE